VTFRYKTESSESAPHYGLVAEEVDAVMPGLVVRGASGEVETVKYHEMPALLLNEIQRQRGEIAGQRRLIEELTRRLEALERR